MYTLKLYFYDNSALFPGQTLIGAFRKIKAARAWSKFVIKRADGSIAFEWEDGGMFHYPTLKRSLPK